MAVTFKRYLLIPFLVANVFSLAGSALYSRFAVMSYQQTGELKQVVWRVETTESLLKRLELELDLYRQRSEMAYGRDITAVTVAIENHINQLGVLITSSELKESVDRLRLLGRQMHEAVSQNTRFSSLLGKTRAELAILDRKASELSRLATLSVEQNENLGLPLAIGQGILLSTTLVALAYCLGTKSAIPAPGSVTHPATISNGPAALVDGEAGPRAGALDGQADARNSEALMSNAADVICLIDARAHFVSVNPAASALFGIDPCDLIGRSLTEFLVTEDGNETLKAAIGAEKSIDKIVFENRWKHPEGHIVQLLWSAHWSAKDNGLFCVVHDITDRKHAEKLLRDSEERIRTVLGRLPVAVFTFNILGHIGFMNESACVLTGYDSEELIDHHFSEVIPEKLLDDNPQNLEQFIAECENRLITLTLTKSSQEAVHVEMTLSRLIYRDQPTFLAVAVDISERNETERLKREFVAMVSHDLRSPLTSIEIIFTVAAQGCDAMDESTRAMLLQGRKESQRLIHLVNNLLDLERMEDGKFRLYPEELSLREVIVKGADTVRPLSDKRNIKISVASCDYRCTADGARLIQVIGNLLSNAIKFSPPDSVIDVGLERCADGIRVSVHDEGRGIPEEKKQVIFERFSQVEHEDATNRGGSGLGLAICKTIIEQQGGRIGVDSNPGRGSTFWFTVRD